MEEVRSKVPAGCPVGVKNVKTLESLSEETLAFTATVYLDGKAVFVAHNHGTGGSNEYAPAGKFRPGDADEYRAAHERINASMTEATEWAKANGYGQTESLDILIGDLIEEADYQKHVRKAVRKGCRFVGIGFKNPYTITFEEPQKTYYWDEYIVGCGSREEFMADAEREGYDAFRVLHEEEEVQ